MQPPVPGSPPPPRFPPGADRVPITAPNIRFFILDKKGQHAGVAMYGSGEKTFALCTDKGAEAPTLEPLLAGNPAD